MKWRRGRLVGRLLGLTGLGLFGLCTTSQCTPLADLCAVQDVSFGFFSKGDCALSRASFFQGHEWLTFFANEDLAEGNRFTTDEVRLLAEGNRRVDWPLELLVHMNNSIVAYIDAATVYTEAPENQKLHFLLTATNTSEEAARDALDEIRRLTVEAIDIWNTNRVRALTLVGQSNHILQDSFSHAHAVREPANDWCIVKLKAYVQRAPGYDTPDIEYHGTSDDSTGHATHEDSIYRAGRDCHEPDTRQQVEACLSEEASRARLATRDYLALVRRVVAGASGLAGEGTASDARRAAIEQLVDAELDPYLIQHFSFCP